MYILILLIMGSYFFGNEPIALITKSIGNVKYKRITEKKIRSRANASIPIFHGDEIRTKDDSFIKIVYLDDRSFISIYPETKISINGEIYKREVRKKIDVEEGIVRVKILNQKENNFILITPYTEITCKECHFWVISNIKDGDHIYSISANGLVTNRTTLNSIELTNGTTIISKKEKEIQEYYTLATENRYLELLMLDANEEYENPYTGRVINKKMLAIPDNMESNMVEIKFKDAFNNEKKIVLTYTK